MLKSHLLTYYCPQRHGICGRWFEPGPAEAQHITDGEITLGLGAVAQGHRLRDDGGGRHLKLYLVWLKHRVKMYWLGNSHYVQKDFRLESG